MSRGHLHSNPTAVKQTRRILLGSFLATTLFLVIPVLVLRGGNSDETEDKQSTLTYLLEWNGGNTFIQPDGTWGVTSDLGFQVTVEAAYLAVYWVQLTECEDHTHEEPLTSAVNWMMPLVAHANHGDDSNQTRSGQPAVTAISPDQHSVVLADLEVHPFEYCQAHYLMGAASDASMGLAADDPRMAGKTILVSGTYIIPGGHEAIPFTFESQEAFGEIIRIRNEQDNEVSLETGGEPAVLQISRNLDTIFNGIDFSEVSSQKGAWDVLRNLAQGTVVTVVSGDVH